MKLGIVMGIYLQNGVNYFKVIEMVDIIELLKKDLKKIKKGEEPSTSHIVFKQKIVCNGKKHTDYYLWQPEEKKE